MCGRLPLALRSAGEQVANSKTFENIARLLRPREERLARLDHGGHLIEERIRTEYERLGERQESILPFGAFAYGDFFALGAGAASRSQSSEATISSPA